MITRLRLSAIHMAVLPIFAGLAFQPSLASAQVFTAQQATAGHGDYDSQCAMCHGAELLGPDAPALIGAEVMQNFDTAAGLYGYISVAMPPQAPGKLSEETYVNILAYILQANGAQPGDKALTADIDELDSIKLAAITSASPAAGNASVESTPVIVVPQAFTWGKALPGGSAENDAKTDTVPQAYTWGKKLPTLDK